MTETVGINVVFTDLVGSTELSSRLGPAATEELRQVHFGLLRGAMESSGGVEVKNLGDGLMVVFPSLTAGLDGCVAMQQAIERHNSRADEPLGVRVGFSAGDATEEDGDYFGDPVVEAARLCAKCEAGQIITTQLISLNARKTDHAFEPIGELELRGVPEPVASVLVRWEPLQATAAIDVPGRLVPDLDLPVAGRVAELASLDDAFKASAAGERRITFLVGEPGIGKTRLAAELAATASATGAAVLYGRADEELTVPYQPWVEAMTYLLDHGPAELVDEAIRLHGPELALLVPTLRRNHGDLATPPSTDPETERYLLLQAVTATIALLSADVPLLIVLDDLHWAGKPTLTMLRHVFTNLTSGRVMFVGTYRDSDLVAGHPLIDTVAALRREPGVELISVGGLDDLEMIDLVEATAGHELNDRAKDMAVLLRRESAGNPFFAYEILRHLVECGDLVLGDDGRWVIEKEFDELAIPQSVRDVVGQRIARLGEAPLKALTAAAVIGRDFELALLAEVTGDDEDDLLDLLEQATSAGILVEVPDGDERFRFQHTLARQTLEGQLSDGRRRRMHRKIAESIEATCGDDPGDRVGELATHWNAATGSAEPDKVTRYAQLAGERAEAGLAPDEAIRWFTMALENLDLADDPDDRTRAEVLVQLGVAQKHAGEPAHRETLLEAGAIAGRCGGTDLMVAAALANNRGFNSRIGSRDDERISALQAALDGVGGAPSSDRALLLATLASELEYAGSYDDRKALIDEAIGMARGLDDPAALGAVLNRFCMSFAVPHTLEARREAAAEATLIAESLGDLTLTFWAAVGSFHVATGAGDREGMSEALERSTAAAGEIGRPSFHWVAGNLAGIVLIMDTDADTIEQHATENLTVGTDAGEPDAFDYFAFNLMIVRSVQGTAFEIIDQVRQAAVDNPRIDLLATSVAAFGHAGGLVEEARTMLHAHAADGFEYEINNGWMTTPYAWALLADRLDDATGAERLRELLAPWSGQVACNRIFAHGVVDSALARLARLLGEYDEAEVLYAAAEAQIAELGAPHFAAEDDLSRARLHRDRDGDGDRALAVQFATQAHDLAIAHGFGEIAASSQQLLDALAAP